MRIDPSSAAAAPGEAPHPASTSVGERLVLAGASLEPLPEGALWWPDEATLVVADLHFEKGSSAARRGSLLPPYDTDSTLTALEGLVARLAPARVVSLGDAFHDPFAPERLSPANLARIAALQAGRDWVWVAGNHDRTLVCDVGGRHVGAFVLGSLTFRHEPSAEPEPGEVAGHLHPAARVALRPKSVRRRCFASDGRRLLVPAFGAYTGGLNILDRACRDLFDRARLTVHLLGEGRVYAFPSRHLVPD